MSERVRRVGARGLMALGTATPFLALELLGTVPQECVSVAYSAGADDAYTVAEHGALRVFGPGAMEFCGLMHPGATFLAAALLAAVAFVVLTVRPGARIARKLS